jgi:hypothetical protein
MDENMGEVFYIMLRLAPPPRSGLTSSAKVSVPIYERPSTEAHRDWSAKYRVPESFLDINLQLETQFRTLC